MSKKSLVIQEYNKGLTVAEICKTTGFNERTVRWAINSEGLKANKKSPGNNLDHEFQEFILGSILGDGCIQKDNRLSIAHCSKQEDYINFKWEFIHKYKLAGKMSMNKVYGERYKNGYFEEFRFKSLVTDKMSGFRNLYYNNGSKIVPDEEFLTEFLTPFAIAIWYMDDGSTCNYNVELNTDSFSRESCNSLRYILRDKYKIKSTLKPSKNVITIKSESIKLFFSLIQEFVVPCMKYKLKTRLGPV